MLDPPSSPVSINDDKVLKISQATRGGVTVVASAANAVPLSFRATGQLKLGAVAAPVFTVCKSGYRGRTVKVTMGGMVKTTPMTTACP